MVLSRNRIMKEVCRNEQKTVMDLEGKKAARDLWFNAVCFTATYGKSSSLDIDDQFGQKIKSTIESQSEYLFGKKKVAGITSVSQDVLDENGKISKIAVSSYLGRSARVEGISITVDKDFAALLTMRGEKINVETWRRFGEVCWDVRTIDVNKELGVASSKLKLLQENPPQPTK